MSALRTILLAEDNPHDVELTLAALHSARLANEIIVVHDGAAVLDCLRGVGEFAGRLGAPPVVAILDLKMPRVTGLEALREIRADPALHALPVVILTSSREENDLVESYDLGANSYMVKPIDFDGFISAVGKLGVYWGVLNEPPPVARVR